MHLFIHEIKISNFLSFFGEHEVIFKPFTAIMCNYHEGKDDFLRSLEFVFGAQPSDIRISNPIDLIHRVLREEFLANHNIQSYVEVTINLVHEKKHLKFRKSLKNGSNTVRIEHQISDNITTKLFYDAKLASLGLNINRKNLIFYKEYFNNIIWGSSEDLEKTISTCLRAKFFSDDLKIARKEVEYLTRLRARTAKIHFNSMKKSHCVLAKFAEKYETVFVKKEQTREKILRDIANASSDDDSGSQTGTEEEEMPVDIIDEAEKLEKINRLETKCDILMEKLDDLNSEKAVLISQLYHEEIKASLKPGNEGILHDRIIETKKKIREQENILSEIWLKMHKVTSETENLSNQISSSLADFKEFQRNIFFQNRYTTYGRFKDYIKPGPYVHLLEKILGCEIFHANFCDSMEDVLCAVDLLKALKLEHRETFISFDNYSHKLKDILIASGEEGVEVNTLEQLLIFLCKLKHYSLIDEVPVIIQGDFNYDDTIPEGYWFYIQTGLLFTGNGCIIYEYKDDSLSLENDSEILQVVIQLQKIEEYKYNEWKDLLALKLETFIEMRSLENDVSYLKQNYKKPCTQPQMERKLIYDTEIYEEYADIFKESIKIWEELEKETHELYPTSQSEDHLRLSESSTESTVSTSFKLKEVLSQINKIKSELEESQKELRDIFSGPFYTLKLQRKVIILSNNIDKTRLFFEKEFKKLQKLMTEDDFEDFTGSQDWRKSVINSLIKDFNEIKTKLKSSTEVLETIKSWRDEKLNPLIQHFERHLASTFAHILDNAEPYIKLNYSARDEKLQLLSSIREGGVNLVEIDYFNTFLKFISALSVFLELAIHEKTAIIVFDDFEEFFPKHDDNLTAVLEPTTIEKIIPDSENPRYQLLMRIGQYLVHYIKKNTPSVSVRNIGINKDYINGPMQIICFTKEDFINAVDHKIWIHNQMLPDEYLTEECDSYSEIHTLNLDNFMPSDSLAQNYICETSEERL